MIGWDCWRVVLMEAVVGGSCCSIEEGMTALLSKGLQKDASFALFLDHGLKKKTSI